ncbi:hypothetical protein [Flavobacterium panacis]|nr:hypothetical protein [Flavobacterium panacis]MCR4031112.1 hypothetical protein [Flavobacterium panacis]
MRMSIKIILSVIILGLSIQCKQNEEKQKNKPQKIEKILAINNYKFIGSTSLKFQFFSDSSYTFTIIKKEDDYEKLEIFKGSCFVKNDTIYFKPFEFKFDRSSEKAVIKNNFIEFDKSALKIEIKKNLFKTKNELDFTKFKDYAIFSFNQEMHSSVYYGYEPNTIKPYDLTQKELVETDLILKKCFSENKSKLEKFDQYIKQCIVVINKKQEKEVWISCYCNDFYFKDTFKYDLIRMNDGGNCNINLKINLTKHNYSDLNISGSA